MKKISERENVTADITSAIEIIQTVLDRANHLIDKEHLAAAVVDLNTRVDDWKSLKVEAFGELLRFGTFTVLKGDGGKDTEREVCIKFLFFLTQCATLYWALCAPRVSWAETAGFEPACLAWSVRYPGMNTWRASNICMHMVGISRSISSPSPKI